MPDTLNIACPNCAKPMAVPVAVAGKKVKCKGCETVFPVPKPAETFGLAPEPPAATAKPAKPAKPVPAKPAKPAKAAEPPKPELTPAQKKHMEDFADDANPYGVTADDLDIARCPACAAVLDPPDTKVCLKCGFNLLERKRYSSKVVYEHTAGDYFKHHLGAIACILVIAGLVTLIIISNMNMRDWFQNSLLDTGEKDENRPGQNKYYLPPGACTLFIFLPSAFIIFQCAKFAIKRLVYEWKPPEIEKKKDDSDK